MTARAIGCLALFLTAVAPPIRAQQDTLPSLGELEARIRAGDSLDARVQFLLAVRYESARRYDDEERALHTAIASDPRYAPAYLGLGDLPYDRDPNLYKDERRRRLSPVRQATLDSAARFRLRAFAINPLLEFHLFGEKPLPQDMVVLPEFKGYERETTNFIGWIGVSAYSVERYDLSYSALGLYWDRRYGSQPEDSIPAWLFFFHGLAAAQEQVYDKAAHDFQVLVDRGEAVERTNSVIPFPVDANYLRYVLAVIKERDHKPADAITLYHDIITRNLGFYMAHAHLAQLYREYKMWDPALTEAQAAVEANPDDASLLVDLAAIDREAGHPADAQAALTKAAALDARYPEVYYRLGIVSQELDQSPAAREAFTRFIAMAPHRLGTEVDDAKKRLGTLH